MGRKHYNSSSKGSGAGTASASSSSSQQHHANELLNFRFTTSAASRQDSGSRYSSSSTSQQQTQRYDHGGGRGGNRGNRHSNNNSNRRQAGRSNNNHNYNKNKNNVIRAQDRSSARKKADSSMFYLHSSAEHAFILTRRSTVRDVVNSSSATRSTNTTNNNNDTERFSSISSSSPSSSYSFNGSDEPVSWDAVRMVKQLVPLTGVNNANVAENNNEPACPICLCELVCPRITKCGHVFCLSCLLRHVQTSSANNPYQEVKCPCCALGVVINDLRTVVFEYVVPPQQQQVVMNNHHHHQHHSHHKNRHSHQQQQPKIRLRKLHRKKHCSAPYLPVPSKPMHSNPHFAPSCKDEDSKFCRFNYIDPEYYIETLSMHQAQLVNELTTLPPPSSSSMTTTDVSSSSSSPPSMRMISNYANDVERIYLDMAMEIVLKQQERAKTDMVEEKVLRQRFAQPTSGMYQLQSPELVYHQNNSRGSCSNKSNHEDGQLNEMSNMNFSHIDDSDHHRQDSAPGVDFAAATDTSTSSRLGRQYRSDSIASHGTSQSIDSVHTAHSSSSHLLAPLSPGSIGSHSRNNSTTNNSGDDKNTKSTTMAATTKKSKPRRPKLCGSMYLDDDTDTHLLYQADDGQLVFLNGFNMTCLLSDYSRTRPDVTTASDGDTEEFIAKPPLPDYIDGVVLEIEKVHLTPDLRKRLPFLSHIPSYTDISFVELDLFPILTESTRRKFKGEFAKRRQRRMSKVQAEKRADKFAERMEMEKINERKARLQIIDPDDEFFRTPTTIPEVPERSITSESFGPALGDSVNPERDIFEPHETTPAPSVTTLSFSQACRQGQHEVITISSTDAFPTLGSSAAETFPALSGGPIEKKKSNSATSQPVTTPQSTAAGGKKKKKGKGQKISLFSTGGQRGY